MTMFSATSIQRALVEFVLPKSPVSNIIASGGGVRNKTLLRFLREQLATHDLTVSLSDEVGLPAAYKEAIKFATLGFATRRGLVNNIPAASGASSFAVLGRMTFTPISAKNTKYIEADHQFWDLVPLYLMCKYYSPVGDKCVLSR